MRLPFPLWSSRSGWGQGAFWDISTRLNSKTNANFSSIAPAGVDWGKSKLHNIDFSRGPGLAAPTEKGTKNLKIFIFRQNCTA